jgi:hypothetical protein
VCRPGALSPQVIGGPDGDAPRRDLQVDRPFGAAGDDQRGVSGVAQSGTEKAARVGIAIDTRERGVKGDVIPRSGRPGGAGQRAGGKDERVLWRAPVRR